MVCASCQASLKGIPLSHGQPAEDRPRLGRRWDLAVFTLLGGGLLATLVVTLSGLVEQTEIGIGLAMITIALTLVLAGLAAAPLRPVDEDRGWGTSALYVLFFLLALLVVMSPVICAGVLYSMFR